MSLEAIEQKCLAYLKQVRNPLVPISQLMRHLNQDPSLPTPTVEELTTFLRTHELFNVVEPMGLALEEDGAKALEEAGLSAEPFALLATRVPSDMDLYVMLHEQMRQIVSALFVATREAEKSGDEKKYTRAKEMLQRASTLQERLEQVISRPAAEN